MRQKTAPGTPLRLIAETDRVFLAKMAPLTIDDPIGHREIDIRKTNSATTVVWNPWSEVAAKLRDLAADAWVAFFASKRQYRNFRA